MIKFAVSLCIASAHVIKIQKRDANMLSHFARNSTDSSVDLTTGQSMYTGEVTFDGNTFTVDFDTGSATLLLPAANFDGHVSGSKTNKKCGPEDKPLEIKYGSGSAVGCEGRGEFGILDYKVSDYKFLAYDEFKQSGGEAFNLCGLGWKELDRGQTNQRPFVQLLFEQGSIDEPMFSFSLANLGTSGSSELYIGELDPSAHDGMIWVPTATRDEGNTAYWMIKHQLKFFTGEEVKDVLTVVDSGTTLIALVPELYSQFIQSWQEKMYGAEFLCVDGPNGLFCGQPVEHCNRYAIVSGSCVEVTDDRHDVFFLQSAYEKLSKDVLDQVIVSMEVETVDKGVASIDITVGDCLLKSGDSMILGVMSTPQGINFNLFGDVFMDNVYTSFSYNRGNAEKTRPALGFGKKVNPVAIVMV